MVRNKDDVAKSKMLEKLARQAVHGPPEGADVFGSNGSSSPIASFDIGTAPQWGISTVLSPQIGQPYYGNLSAI